MQELYVRKLNKSSLSSYLPVTTTYIQYINTLTYIIEKLQNHNFEVRHPRCVSQNQKTLESQNTTVFYIYIYIYIYSG